MDDRRLENNTPTGAGAGQETTMENREGSGASKKRKKRVARIVALVLAAAVLLTALPLGGIILLANRRRRNSVFPDPKPIVFTGGEYSGKNPSLPPALEKVKVTADGVDSKVIPIDGAFIVETSGETDAETLAGYMTMTPAIPTSVTKLAPTKFRIAPASGGLAPGQIYRLTLGNPENPVASFAFQTENNMIVTSMFPADRTLNVPVNTGIEVTFSDAVVMEAGKDPFAVSPQVKGSFSLYPDGRTVLFLPSAPLSYDTVYTVTVNEGVTGRSGKTFSGDRKAVFRTCTKTYEKEGQNGSGVNYLRTLLASSQDRIYSPGSDAGFDFSVVTSFRGTVNVTCDLYAFGSAAEAAKTVVECEKRAGDESVPQFDVTGLTKIGSFTPQAKSRTSFSVDFGNGLARGVYAAVITSTGSPSFGVTLSDTRSVIVQISDLRPYTVSSDGKTYVWLNGTGAGPVAGADVSATLFDRYDGWNAETDGETKSVRTDASGLAVFENGGRNSAVILVGKGDDAAVVCASTQPQDTYDYYMSFIFTDRETYFSDDTVNFSGYIAPSFDGSLPDHLNLETGLSTTKTRVEVDETGFFRGSLTYSRCEAGYFALRFCDDGGHVIAGKSFRITEEEKPQYTASAAFDKLFYRRGENITVTVTASFFDGTPVEGLEFLCFLNYFGENTQTVKTDKNGEAKITYKPRKLRVNEVYGTDPVNLYFRAELTNFETQTLMTTASTYYFHSDYVLKTKQDANSSSVTLNRLDTSRLKTADDFSWQVFPENTKGEPLTSKDALTYTLYKRVIVKTVNYVYNSYTRRNEKQYKYSVNEQVLEQGKKSFENGVAEFPLREVKGFDGYFVYAVDFYDDSSNNVYHFNLNGTAGRRDYSERDYHDRVEITLNADSYSVNDKVVATFKAASGAEKALFVTVANGIADVKYADKAGFVYTNDMIAGGRIYAVAFDGETGTYSQTSKRLAYNIDRATLTPEITASSGIYRPGDTATVTVKVPGAGGGFAVVSIVDEACFALGEQKLTPSVFFNSSNREGGGLFGFYEYYYDYYDYGGGWSAAPSITLNGRFVPAFTYSGSESRDGTGYYGNDEKAESALSDRSEEPEAMPAPGDGRNDASGSWYVRKYFADNPVYKVVELDSEGRGTLTFTVPDNITSWRISALALSGAGRVNGELKIGASVSNVVCTQPFFVNLGVCSQYIVGDTISVSARAYGPESDGEVKYTAVLTDALGNEKGTASGAANSKDRCWLKFDVNEPGQYTVTVYAECGSNRDAVTADFNLVTTAVAADVTKTVTVDELKNINPVYYPVRLLFTNRTESYALFERIAGILSYDRGSGRTDEYAALYAAAEARGTLYGFKSDQKLEYLLGQIGNNFSRQDCKYRLFQYSEPDTKLTAAMLALGLPVDLNTRNLIANEARGCVASSDQKSPEELLANIVCLAALDEPVLDTLYAVAETAGNFSNEAKLWLALGFALCGDYPAAYDVYSGIKESIGVADSEYGTLKFDDKVFDTSVSLTCLALMSASRIAREDASAMALWLCENRSDASSAQLALAGYLRYFLPTEKAETLEFTYSAGGQDETVRLEPGMSFTLSLSKPEFDALKLSLPGDAKVGVYYRGSLEEALSGEQAADDRVKIEKTMNADSRGNCVVTLRIRGKSTRVWESFELYDIIPSGARFLSLESRGYSRREDGRVHTSAYIYNSSGQNMNGYVSVYNEIYKDTLRFDRTECPEYSFDISVSYVIRGAVDGHFIAESAFVKNCRTGVFSISGRKGVDIRENGGWKFTDE